MKDNHIATAKGLDLGISTKFSIEICNYIKGKSVKQAKQILEEVLMKKTAIPLKRFNKDRGHKKGEIASGAYPQKASAAILKLIKSAESNANNIGLNTESLYIKNILANRASSPMRHGRQRRISAKRTHVDIILEEKEPKKTKEEKKATKK
ncbi:MAG: 50S ribosomal protein L22 [Candidatus Nanoarchaeia archaeon]|nr:50S ribosomal protein L22 [Candidatus Nanoarchaeia archaeon]